MYRSTHRHRPAQTDGQAVWEPCPNLSQDAAKVPRGEGSGWAPLNTGL